MEGKQDFGKMYICLGLPAYESLQVELQLYVHLSENIKSLLTEHEVCTGKYQPKVLTVRTEP